MKKYHKILLGVVLGLIGIGYICWAAFVYEPQYVVPTVHQPSLKQYLPLQKATTYRDEPVLYTRPSKKEIGLRKCDVYVYDVVGGEEAFRYDLDGYVNSQETYFSATVSYINVTSPVLDSGINHKDNPYAFSRELRDGFEFSRARSTDDNKLMYRLKKNNRVYYFFNCKKK